MRCIRKIELVQQTQTGQEMWVTTAIILTSSEEGFFYCYYFGGTSQWVLLYVFEKQKAIFHTVTDLMPLKRMHLNLWALLQILIMLYDLF